MITTPTNCPCCDSILQWSNDLLYCRNPSCEAQSSKQIEHFVKTLKIKGLGPSTLAKLKLESSLDIYDLTLENLINSLGSEKIAVKLLAEIEQSKNQPLNIVLPAFGIPLIGKTASDKLAKVSKKLTEITAQTCADAGLGEKATNNLLHWLDNNLEYVQLYPFDLKFTKILETNSSNKEVVCLSGKLTSFPTKQEATVALEKAGYEIKTSLTKDVTILVNESGRETTKTKTARDSGIIIITNLKEFLGELN